MCRLVLSQRMLTFTIRFLPIDPVADHHWGYGATYLHYVIFLPVFFYPGSVSRHQGLLVTTV